MLLFLFFFFKQKTAYEMRISDWSSDVCSSDLHGRDGALPEGRRPPRRRRARRRTRGVDDTLHSEQAAADRLRTARTDDGPLAESLEIGRASCRERVCPYV